MLNRRFSSQRLTSSYNCYVCKNGFDRGFKCPKCGKHYCENCGKEAEENCLNCSSMLEEEDILKMRMEEGIRKPTGISYPHMQQSQISQRGEAARIWREQEDERIRIEHESKFSGGKWFLGVIVILAVLALGWYSTQNANNPALSILEKSIPSASAVVTLSADQKTLSNFIGMEFVQMPIGEFDMGSPSNELGRYDSEGPVHHVKISNAFYMGKYEVTQKQWRNVMESSPSYFKGYDLPVEQVSWNDVQEFIKKLNDKEGGNNYRLPSEAEWEYAARAGTTTRYSFGDDESKLGDYAWYDANSGSKTHSVGQKKPNPWGLYDMHGNVFEWVQDIYQRKYNNAPTDGSAWEISGSDRVIRGGNWLYRPWLCRSAGRLNRGPGVRDDTLGFHLLRIL